MVKVQIHMHCLILFFLFRILGCSLAPKVHSKSGKRHLNMEEVLEICRVVEYIGSEIYRFHFFPELPPKTSIPNHWSVI